MLNALTKSDLDYYRSRLAAELALAAGAADAQVARAHRELAAKYSRLLTAEVPNDDEFDGLQAWEAPSTVIDPSSARI